MRTITRDDLKIILRLAIHLAKVDEEVSLLEKKIVGQLLEKAGFNGEERAGLGVLKEDPTKLASQLSSPEAKEFLVKLLCALSKSDGMLHYAESQFLTKINESLGLPVEIRPWEEWLHYESEVLETINRL